MKKIIKNVRVFDGERLTDPTNVVIEDGYISSIGDTDSDATDILDGQGQTLLPGFIDCHVHVSNKTECENAVKYGVTTMIDQACENAALIDSLKDPSEPITSVRSAYSTIQSEWGPMMVKALGYKPDYAKTKDDIRRMVDEQIAKGASIIKLILDLPPLTTGMLSEELVEEAVKYAHGKGMLVSAHCTSVEAYHRAIKYSVDFLNHVPKADPIPEDCFEGMKGKALVDIPTLGMIEGIINNLKGKMADKAGDFSVALDSVRRMNKAGVKILVGTDANHTNAMCYLNHGEATHHEFALLSEAGVSNLNILRGTTVEAAKQFRLLDRGSICGGKRADLVLVDGDPLKDISACGKITHVWVKGEEADIKK